MSYFLLYSHTKKNQKLNCICLLCNNTDLKNATGVDASKFAEKDDLADLNSEIDKLDIDKLKDVTNGLSNL